MEDQPPERRSSRKRKRSTKYVINPLQDSDALRESEDPTDRVAAIGDLNDGELGLNDAGEGAEPDDISLGNASDSTGFVDHGDSINGDLSDYDGTIPRKSTVAQRSNNEKPSGPHDESTASKSAKNIVQGKAALSTGGVRDRTVRQIERNSSKDANLLSTFGPHEDDIAPFVKARSKWLRELTIPSRLNSAHGEGGMGYSFYQTDEQRQKERTEGWEWYYRRGGRAAFQAKQVVTPLTDLQAQTYLSTAACQFIAGDILQQRLFTLEPRQVMNLGAAWPIPNQDTSISQRSGWIINSGDSAENIDWAPNRENGSSHFLAIGGSSKMPCGTDEEGAFKAQSAPSFTPATPSTPASIQIWEFTSTPSPGETVTLDPQTKPRLRAVLCVDWGPVKQFKWAPFLRDNPWSEDSASTHLGLLAILCGDGAARIFDITLPSTVTPSSSPIYLHLATAAFTSRPPDTILTCLTWPSPQVLAAGCANGYLVAWNITAHLLSPSSPFPAHAHPALYHPLHASYILSIKTCLPSRPHQIITSSLDGYHRLTSLHSPSTDTVPTPRARITNPHTVWLDTVQHVLAADDAYNIHAHNARRMHVASHVSRGDASISAMAGSAVHMGILVGQADGEVWVMNPLRKTLHGPKGEGMWKQIWFRCEWRRGGVGKVRQQEKGRKRASEAEGLFGEEGAEDGEEEGTECVDRGNGLARLTTGYVVKHVTSMASKTPASRVAQGSGVVFSTIYEEKSGVKSLAWNPNLKAGGWAAAGTGTGLVWVEDIAWDGDK